MDCVRDYLRVCLSHGLSDVPARCFAHPRCEALLDEEAAVHRVLCGGGRAGSADAAAPPRAVLRNARGSDGLAWSSSFTCFESVCSRPCCST